MTVQIGLQFIKNINPLKFQLLYIFIYKSDPTRITVIHCGFIKKGLDFGIDASASYVK